MIDSMYPKLGEGNQARNHTSAIEGNIPVFWGGHGTIDLLKIEFFG